MAMQRLQNIFKICKRNSKCQLTCLRYDAW